MKTFFLYSVLCVQLFSLSHQLFNHTFDDGARIICTSAFVADSHSELVRVPIQNHIPRFDLTRAEDFLSLNPVDARIIRSLSVKEWETPFFLDPFFSVCFFTNFCLECNTFCLWGEGAWAPSCGWLVRDIDMNACEQSCPVDCCSVCEELMALAQLKISPGEKIDPELWGEPLSGEDES